MSDNKRIILVDALRGFALFMIVLIHFVEHFDFFYPPDFRFLFSETTDNLVMEIVLFLVSGKAYSVFALLFGFSFFIQLSRQEASGKDFRGRFTWRLIILLGMGFIHSLFYKGDILHIYALLGLLLVPLYKVKSRHLMVLAAILALQVPMIYHLVCSLLDSTYTYDQSFASEYWREANEVYAFGSLWDVMTFNFWKGRATVWAWTFYNGRYLQLIALFLIGFVLGRKRIFENLNQHIRAFTNILIAGVIVVLAFLALENITKQSGLTGQQKHLVTSLLKSYSGLAFTAVIICIITLLYHQFGQIKGFQVLAAYGRMSLSNYVFQALVGVVFFYGWGFGMYRYLGTTWSLITGIFIFALQALISFYWTRKFYYGPLEWLWRSLTFLNFDTKFRKS